MEEQKQHHAVLMLLYPTMISFLFSFGLFVIHMDTQGNEYQYAISKDKDEFLMNSLYQIVL